MTNFVVTIPEGKTPCPALDIVICAMDGDVSYLCRGGAFGRHCYEDWQKPCMGSGVPTQGADWCPIPKREKQP